jgi:hypothetical protein
MITMDDIPVTPNSFKPESSTQSLRDADDSDDEGDGGERALLSEDTQARWQEEKPSNAAAFWKQNSGIIIEVSASSLRSIVPYPRTLDATNAPLHHVGQSIHRAAAFRDICM